MESILDKIKKLIKKQESAAENGSTEEAEAFAVKIQELLNKHNLDKSSIKLEEDENEDFISDTSMSTKIPSIGGNSSYQIMSVICKYNWCEASWLGRMKDNSMLIIGSKENIEICKYLHSFLVRFVLMDGKNKYLDYKQQCNFYGAKQAVGFDTYMRSFIKGFSHGLEIKFDTERNKFMGNNEMSTALVRTNEVALKDFSEKAFGKTKIKKVNVVEHGGSYRKGVQAGELVQIRKGITSESKPIDRKMLN